MSREEIEIVIDEDGQAQVSVSGVSGSGCTKLTKELEEALGGSKDKKLTNEYRMQGRQAPTQKQRN